MTILDASTVINLINGGALELVLGLEGFEFAVGPIVLDECGSHRERLRELVGEGRLQTVSDDEVPASLFLALLERYGLGNGETECVAVAMSTDAVICCDDRVARHAIVDALGSHRLSGSLGLLREAVRQRLLTSKEALAVHELMRVKGGFLPEVADEFFSETSDEDS